MFFYRKILVIRMTIVLLTAVCLQAGAVGYSQKVTLTERQRPLEAVFRDIKAQTGYVFWYKLDILKYARPVTVDLRGQELAVVLDSIFNHQPLTYTIISKTIAVKLKDDGGELPPGITVTGKVTDEKGVPLAGVTIQVKGAPGGVTSDVEGVFRMPGVREDAVLVFSSVGYQTQEVRLSGRENLTVALHSETQSLGDMVVIGYGSASRRSLSSAISTIKADDLNKGAITDVGQLLQGKAPGLNITSSGDPNKPAAVILRGASTINSPGGPFYVIDGVPGADISTIAPDDIASVDILKDAAATAIYGNRAANGLIMITTKRGKKGQTVVTYNGYVGTEQVSNRVQVMNAPELRAFVTKNNLGFSSTDDKGANTDWQKAIERSTAVSNNQNISFSGGGEHNTYSATINYVKKEGIIRNTDLTRVIGRLNVDQYAFNDRLRFSLNVVNSYSNGNEVPYLGVILLQAAHYLPISPVKNPDGSYFEDHGIGGYYNPVAMQNNSTMNDKNNNLIASLNTQVRLPWGLSYDVDLSFQNYSNLHGEYYDSYFTTNYNDMYNNPDPGPTGRTQQAFGPNGQAYRSSYTSNSKLLETFFTWDRHFGDHAVKAVLGYSWQDNINNDGFQVTTFNFPVDNISYNNFALSAPYANPNLPKISFGPDGIYQETKLIADFLRVNYSYHDKYLFQGSVRRDGSSVFGANHQFGYFPSVSAGWRINQEAFMSGQHIFDDLKLRGSYGVVGNAFGFNAYTAQTFSGLLGTFYSGGSQVNAYGPTQAANPNLKWEQTAVTDIGVDFAILRNRVSGSLDVYNKNTTGMIFPYTVDQFLVPTGSIVANGGGMNNKGIELTLNATPVRRADLSWTTTVNLSHNINKITSLNNPLFAGVDSIPEADPEGGGESGVKLQVLKAGRPLGQYFTLQYAGKAADGTTLFVDHTGKPDSNYVIGTDYHYLGNAQPKLIYGWGNTLSYKSWSLNVFFRGVLGDRIFNATRADLFRPATAGTVNILKDAAGELPSDPNVFRYSSRFIESGSYLRLDNATLAYTFHPFAPHLRTIRAYATV
ncbi:MAG TPA: SusC/RagA family TonB-linked outer membrane protein, partial [Puia sp.]|nr:SusC/RagA family TonB-linked outer membrane protein [Puia sp.]